MPYYRLLRKPNYDLHVVCAAPHGAFQGFFKKLNCYEFPKVLQWKFSLEKHPQTTSMGRVEKGFEFLGYHYGRDGLGLAEKTIGNFISKALRLYEREPVQTRLERLGEYTKWWVRWTTSGLHSLEMKTQ